LPGAELTISISAKINNLALRIGCHTDDISQREQWARFPKISKYIKFNDATQIEVTTFDGGLIYFEIDEAPIYFNYNIYGEVVRAPYFNIEKHSLSEWETIRKYPGPIAEVEGEHLIYSVQTRFLVKNNRPDLLAKHWGTTMLGEYYNFSGESIRTYKERWVTDIDISHGYMHCGYPIMSYLDQNDAFCVDISPAFMEKDNLHNFWGEYHEIGHNFQSPQWTFNGMIEVSVNWFTMYFEELYPDHLAPNMFGDYNFDQNSDLYKKALNFKKNPNFETLFTDAFLSLYLYVEIRMGFGWQAFRNLFKDYLNSTPDKLPKNDDEKRDQLMVRFSKVANRNLYPLFSSYGIPMSQSAKNEAEKYPKWDSNKIVDCATTKGPCATLSIENPISNNLSQYIIKINTWAPLRKMQGEKFVFTFIGDAPAHPTGMKNDNNFQLTLDSNTANLIDKTAVWISDSTSTRLEVNILKFVSSDQNLVISFNCRNTTLIKYYLVGLNIKIINNKGIIKHIEERSIENNVQLRTLRFFEESYNE